MENTKRIKLVTKYTFNDSLERVFNLLTEKDIFIEIMGPKSQNLTFTAGTNFCEEGTIISFNYQGFIPLEIHTNKVVKTDNYIDMDFTTKCSVPVKIEYDFSFTFLWDSIENNTLFLKELTLSSGIDDEAVKCFNEDEKQMIKRMECALRLRKIKEQTHSICINVSINELWESIVDWRVLIKKVPKLGETVEYDGDVDKIGTRLRIKGKDSEFLLKLIKCEKNEAEGEIVLELLEGKCKTPLELVFNLIKIDEENTYIVFKHIFGGGSKFRCINELGSEKKKILKCLKKSFSK
jgi:hypothetical protein